MRGPLSFCIGVYRIPFEITLKTAESATAGFPALRTFEKGSFLPTFNCPIQLLGIEQLWCLGSGAACLDRIMHRVPTLVEFPRFGIEGQGFVDCKRLQNGTLLSMPAEQNSESRLKSFLDFRIDFGHFTKNRAIRATHIRISRFANVKRYDEGSFAAVAAAQSTPDSLDALTVRLAGGR